jgi:DNA-binding NarL/FixJ family response regulator
MILVAVRDLFFGSKIDAAAKQLGVEVVWAPRNVPLSIVVLERRPALILADLGEPGMMEELRSIRARVPATRVIGFLGHLRTDLIDEARSIGIEEVLTRGQLAASLEEVLQRVNPKAAG